MTPAELSELEAKCRAATPGPWLYRAKSDSVHTEPDEPPYQYGDHVFSFSDEAGPSEADAAFIAASSPERVLELIQEVRRLVEAESSLLRRIDVQRDWITQLSSALQSVLAVRGLEDPYSLLKRAEAHIENQTLKARISELEQALADSKEVGGEG